MSDEELLAFERRWWDQVWEGGDLALIDQLVADPYIRHNSAGTRRVSRAELKKDMVQYQRVLHAAVTTIDDYVIQGDDRIWIRATSRGANLETGDANLVTWLLIHRVVDGMLVESWSATISGIAWDR